MNNMTDETDQEMVQVGSLFPLCDGRVERIASSANISYYSQTGASMSLCIHLVQHVAASRVRISRLQNKHTDSCE